MLKFIPNQTPYFMFTRIEKLCRKFESERESISEERKTILKSIAKAIDKEIEKKRKSQTDLYLYPQF